MRRTSRATCVINASLVSGGKSLASATLGSFMRTTRQETRDEEMKRLTNRQGRSLLLFFKILRAFLKKGQRALGTTQSGYFEFLASQLVIRDEEFLNLCRKRRNHVFDGRNVFVAVGVNADCQQTIVAFGFSVLGLLRLDHTNETHIQQTSDVGRFIHQHHHIQRVSVVPQRRRDKSEVEWKHHSFRQKARELEEP
jgi:hypothetical protein